MRLIKPITNMIKYGSFNFMPQVDPDYMKPIFEDKFRQSGLYSPDDYVELWKTRKDDLRFHYVSNSNTDIVVGGAIYAQKPRSSFEDVDIISFMLIDMLTPDKDRKILDSLKNIVEDVGIERIVAYCSIWVNTEDAEYLNAIRGGRNPAHLKYGHGAFAR